MLLLEKWRIQNLKCWTRPGGVDCNEKLYIVKEHYRLGTRWDWLQKRNVI